MRRRKISPTIAAHDIRGPYSDPRRDGPLLRHVRAGHEEKVIAADQHQRQNQPGGAAAAARTHADRHSQQRENQARRGKGDAPLKFDARFAPVGSVSASSCETDCSASLNADVFGAVAGCWKYRREFRSRQMSSRCSDRGSRGSYSCVLPAAQMQLDLPFVGAGDHARVLARSSRRWSRAGPEDARNTSRHRVAAASTSCTYNMRCGNRSSKTRGWMAIRRLRGKTELRGRADVRTEGG